MRSQTMVRVPKDYICFAICSLIVLLFFGMVVTCTVTARKVSIKGVRGTVTKDFSHVACELKKMKQDSKKRKGTYIRIRIWFGGTKQSCAVNTLKSHIGNMIIGVTEVSFRTIIPSSSTQSPTKCELLSLYGVLSYSVFLLINNYILMGV